MKTARILVLMGALVLVAPFTKETNYMSIEGYNRWLQFLKTGTWTVQAHGRGPKEGPKEGPKGGGDRDPQSPPCSQNLPECQR